VETIAGINDFVREATHFYGNLRENMLRIVLVHPGEFILPELGEKLGRYTERKLTERGVEILVNTKVIGVTEEAVELSSGEKIQSKALIWTAGTSPNPVLDSLPCVKEHGRLKVDEMLRVPDWPGVWALGDCALVPDIKTGKFHPPTAQHALREGKTRGRPETILVQHHRTARCDRPAHRSRQHLWHKLLRVSGLVDVAHHLSQQAAAI
jgi:NADH dehydrogenase